MNATAAQHDIAEYLFDYAHMLRQFAETAPPSIQDDIRKKADKAYSIASAIPWDGMSPEKGQAGEHGTVALERRVKLHSLVTADGTQKLVCSDYDVLTPNIRYTFNATTKELLGVEAI